MRFALDTPDRTSTIVTIRCGHDDALLSDLLKSIKKRRRLVGLDVFHDFAGSDDVELSESEGCRITMDEFVIQTESRTEFQVWLVDVYTHDMSSITPRLRPQQKANPASPASHI